MTDNNQNLKDLVEKKKEKALRKEDPKQRNLQLIKAMEPQIKAGLPEHIDPKRFTRIRMSALSSTPELADATPVSFIGALMQSAQLGLEPNTPLGQAYLIPYWNGKKNVREVQFQIGYKGLLDLALRTGRYKTVTAREVYENDKFEIEYGLEPKLKHIPNMKEDRGSVIGYYAVYTLTNGGYDFGYMTKKQAEDHGKKYSKSFNNGPWKTNFDSMALKTVLKNVLKYAPLSPEIQEVLGVDESSPKAKENVEGVLELDWEFIPNDVDPETGEIIELEEK